MLSWSIPAAMIASALLRLSAEGYVQGQKLKWPRYGYVGPRKFKPLWGIYELDANAVYGQVNREKEARRRSEIE
jgi:hypothetical protein